ncbi:related to Transaldolase B [Sporisorium reilianum f. sp. reilianum]|uniref:Related to Transaldolase B n=1 Tax=Sporisorium reilianum f. sp. reilianum TaxID=72559 RepID=A0A2N8UP86_9BASI|nr:related to Transaldolase B [Sporisorium reilianum f. sp. reilianum]
MTAETVPLIVRAAQQLEIDVDGLDVDLTLQLKALGVEPNDMTSNQFIVADALALEQNQALLEQVIRDSPGADWLTLLDRVSVKLCALNIGNISGRALLQASPAHAYDTEAIVAHARAYDREFAAAGIGKDRYCIKILSTGAGMRAAQMLESQYGIRTLGTGLFGVPQALAAAQAGCLYISPYFNEILVHFMAPADRPAFENPARQHPMAARMAHIYQAYRQLALASPAHALPVIKGASYIAINEVLAMPELGSQQTTILAPTLAEMIALQTTAPAAGEKLYKPSKTYAYDLPESTLPLLKLDPLRADGVAQTFDVSTDYLANNAAELEKTIQEDAETARRIKDAVEVFQKAELQAKALIEAAVLKVGAVSAIAATPVAA